MRYLFSRQFDHFRAVCATGNQRQAAARAGISQPALSKSIHLLEQNFGTELFERSPKGMIPTKAGRLLAERMARMEREARYAELEVGGLVEGTGGTIYIGTGLAWSWKHVPVVLSKFHAEFPNVIIEAVNGITDVLLPRLLNGDLDLIISDVHDIALPPEFVVEKTWHVRRRAWVRSGHPLAGRNDVTWADLAEFQWAGHNADVRLTGLIARHFQSLDLPLPTIILRASSLMTILGMLAGSDLVGILSDNLSAEAHQRGIVPLDIDTNGWDLEAGVVYRPEVMDIRPFRRLLSITKTETNGFAPA
ncbi:LysR family transcriptional regulator [Pararhizobium mangrovi]|uniref:LysR family transcriptional regulator n=1 Tax=Pararhizobium mangrovi TaxID=2590452 RepID=A0A506UF76_9HYPH|nr:LysR family transcriptional regulator [Pararhizobium mangrovi]TPW31871.1 LysR family transcriptional regulator [Pararhizobium mangrovi]